MIPNQLPNIWLGEARAHLHASVRAMAQPRLRIVHARKAWTFAISAPRGDRRGNRGR